MTTLQEIKTKISKIKKSQMSQHTSIIETLKMIVEFLEQDSISQVSSKKSFLDTKKEKKDDK